MQSISVLFAKGISVTREVLIVGSGVIGMTAAAELLTRGVPVRIYTSKEKPVAGLNGVGILERQGDSINLVQQGRLTKTNSIAWEDRTFKKCEGFIREGSQWVSFMPVEYHRMTRTGDPFEVPYNGMEARELTDEEIIPPYQCGVLFNGFIINTRGCYAYLQNLVHSHQLFQGVEYGEIESPEEVNHPCALIACGMGQRAWDSQIVPGLGETLLMRDSSIPRSKVIGGIRKEYSANLVPIPGKRDEFILGASKRDGLDETSPRQSWWDQILNAGCEICPQLEHSDVLERRVGVRPKRIGGILVEADEADGQRRVIAGGFGGSGWTLSWGFAEWAAEFLMS